MTNRWSPFLHRHGEAAVIGLVVLALGAIIFLTIRWSQDGRRPASPSGPAAGTTLSATTPAGEMLRLIEEGKKLTFEGRYAAYEDSAPSSIHVWRRPPLARLDTETGSGEAQRRTQRLASSSGPVNCVQQGQGPWTCTPAPNLRVGDVTIVSDAVLGLLSRLAIESRDDQISGRQARCFLLTGNQGSPAELCLTRDGIPLRVVAGATRVELVDLKRDRPPDFVFEPPVAPR